ncbi:MAG: hypothetical protein FWG34_00715 [Oscillospiraceae bacterium]|nr:hypothetical protein [Oscillospiraceae bacterium]
MTDKSFMESIDDETLAKLIDTTLKFEKAKQTGKMKFTILKMLPAAAAVLLLIGLFNIMPAIINPGNIETGAGYTGPGAASVSSVAPTSQTETQSPCEPVELFVPPIVEKSFFEEKILANIPDSDQRAREKMLAYYRLIDLEEIGAGYEGLDPDDPGYAERIRAIKEAIEMYPICQRLPVYVFDPHASNREIAQILGFLKTYTTLLGDELIQMYLDNGIPYADLPMLTGEDFEGEDSTSVTQQHPSEVTIEPIYGLCPTEDGAKYLEFKNRSLYGALMEYFGMDRWIGDRITLDMLARINSIKIEVKPEYSYIYDNKGLREEFGLDCKYIEYTINGKTLDILPEKFMEGGVLEGHMEQAGLDINEYFDYEPGHYDSDYYVAGYFVTKPSLTLEEKLRVYETLAWGGAVRMPVEQNDDGSYRTNFYNASPSIYLIGFPSRYYDQSEYDAEDTQYMPNLQEFGVSGMPTSKFVQETIID